MCSHIGRIYGLFSVFRFLISIAGRVYEARDSVLAYIISSCYCSVSFDDIHAKISSTLSSDRKIPVIYRIKTGSGFSFDLCLTAVDKIDSRYDLFMVCFFGFSKLDILLNVV